MSDWKRPDFISRVDFEQSALGSNVGDGGSEDVPSSDGVEKLSLIDLDGVGTVPYPLPRADRT